MKNQAPAVRKSGNTTNAGQSPRLKAGFQDRNALDPPSTVHDNGFDYQMVMEENDHTQ
jgi:hypothetical protein